MAWLQAYGQLIGVALGGSLAGGVALLVGRMNNRASDARLVNQIAHERDREERRLSRDRREELYVSLETWLAALEQHMLVAFRLAAGKISYEQYLDLQATQSNRIKVDVPRLKMLLNVYGTATIQQDYLKVTNLRDSVNEVVFDLERIAKISIDLARRDSSFHALDKLAGELRESGRVLLASVAAAIASDRTTTQ